MTRWRAHWPRTALAAVAALAVCWSAALLPQEIDPETSARLQAVDDALARIESWLEETRRRQSTEEARLSELQGDINTLMQQQQANRQQLDALQGRLAQLDARQQELLLETEAQRAQIAGVIRAAYLRGTDSRLKMLLNQQDPDTAQRMMVYFNTLNASHLEQIRQWQQTLEALQANRLDVEHTRQTLVRTNEHLQEQQIALIDVQQQREQVIADLQRQLAERSGERETLLQDRADLQALIDEINRIIVDIPAPEELMPFSASRGQMPWPVSGPLLSRYGERYGGGNLQRQGLIIGAAADTPVRAIHPGRVVFADWLRGSGNLLVIDHGEGYVSLYAHNQRLVKQNGDWVNRGEAIAVSGQDAGTGAPGLYFEIRRQRQPLNPTEWLQAAGS